MHLKISSAKWRPYCPGGDELKCHHALVYWIVLEKPVLYLHPVSFLNSEMAQVVEILPYRRQWHTVLEIPTGPPVRGQQLWRRTGNFSLIFLQFYVFFDWVSNTDDISSLYCQHPCCWCLGDARSQAIKSHGLDVSLWEYSSASEGYFSAILLLKLFNVIDFCCLGVKFMPIEKI